jgi:signal peptidase
VVSSVLAFWVGLSLVLGIDHPILAVASESMEPVLYKGDLIVVEGIQESNDIYAASANIDPPGDIVVYQGTTQLIVHRVIDKKTVSGNTIFVFHGDANPLGANENVDEDRLVGRYVGFKIPWMGHVALFFDSLENKVGFVILWIIILLVIEFAPSIKKKAKKYSQTQTN